MSYCRFENTAKDLGDCLDAIENGKINDLSSYEKDGIRDLLHYCDAILKYQEQIEAILEEELDTTEADNHVGITGIPNGDTMSDTE